MSRSRTIFELINGEGGVNREGKNTIHCKPSLLEERDGLEVSGSCVDDSSFTLPTPESESLRNSSRSPFPRTSEVTLSEKAAWCSGGGLKAPEECPWSNDLVTIASVSVDGNSLPPRFGKDLSLDRALPPGVTMLPVPALAQPKVAPELRQGHLFPEYFINRAWVVFAPSMRGHDIFSLFERDETAHVFDVRVLRRFDFAPWRRENWEKISEDFKIKYYGVVGREKARDWNDRWLLSQEARGLLSKLLSDVKTARSVVFLVDDRYDFRIARLLLPGALPPPPPLCRWEVLSVESPEDLERTMSLYLR